MVPQRQYGVGSTRETSDNKSIWHGATISQIKCWQWENAVRTFGWHWAYGAVSTSRLSHHKSIHQSINWFVRLSSRLFVCQSVSLSSALLNPRRHTTLISLEQQQLWSVKMTTAAKAIKSINEPIPTNQFIYTFHCIIGFETCASLNEEQQQYPGWDIHFSNNYFTLWNLQYHFPNEAIGFAGF